MSELKEYQPSITIDEQVDNLKSIGILINDEQYAKRILNDISYFRLMQAYSFNLKENDYMYFYDQGAFTSSLSVDIACIYRLI